MTGLAVARQQRRAIRHFVAFALAAVFVVYQHFAAARNRDQLTARVGHITHGRRVAHHAGGFAFDLAYHRGTRCRATNVESTHGELRARLADGLRGDHADRFADVDDIAAAEIAAVAVGAQAIARFAGERRAHLDFIETERFDRARRRPHQAAYWPET